MAVDNSSLITVEEYWTFSGNDSKIRTENRAQLVQMINWASIQVEDHLGRTLISGSSETEIFDGLGTPHPDLIHYEFITKQAPLIASPTPKLFTRSSADWSAVSTSTYTWDATNGTVYFTDGNYFISGKANYKVEYDYGYANTAAIPSSIKLATSLLVKFNEVQRDNIGVASSSDRSGKNKTFTDTGLPSAVTSLLKPYVRS